PGTHSNPINAEKEMLLHIINRMRERQKAGIRKPACTGIFFSRRMPAIKGSKSLKKGASFQPAFFSALLIRMVKDFSFCEAITINAKSGSYFPFFNGVFFRCLNGIYIR
ncbi:MAG TPA: hypothetical protein VII44_10785, partial [Puia sp.]